MALMRLIILIIFLLSWVAVVLQNQAALIALVFLGMQSPFLPLGLWLGIAVLMGVILGLALWGIIALPPRFSARKGQPFSNRATTARSQTGRSKARPSPQPRSPSSYSDWDEPSASDWQSESDWGASGQSARRKPAANFFDDEDQEEDFYPGDDPADFFDQEDRADSFYSYSDRDPDFVDGDGQRESVFDAEYRVLPPPQRPSPDRGDTLEEDRE
ncbi:MAG: LapA family protein [Acaryochloridaceae cyanobacterium SU_2_1]|nr:LapA family protein [Acaryochloridaceae cyanobacterium SU_2_1]